jgi:hypothetical protein
MSTNIHRAWSTMNLSERDVLLQVLSLYEFFMGDRNCNYHPGMLPFMGRDKCIIALRSIKNHLGPHLGVDSKVILSVLLKKLTYID